MTAQERITLRTLSDKLDAYIAGDIAWKREVDDWRKDIVEPIVSREQKREVINEWWRDKAKLTTKVVGFIVSVALAWNYVGKHVVDALTKGR